ncbi:MAG: hypothetical protein RMI74_08500 [Thermodesulfobacterium sp.]|nr:hypothetical protein [Thermodesulfobacterium sp.]
MVKNKKEIDYIFVKGDRVVISNDDLLAIKTYYKLYPWVKDFEKKLKMDGNEGVIRLL